MKFRLPFSLLQKSNGFEDVEAAKSGVLTEKIESLGTF
jgi:hypothetical protein